MSRKIVIGDIHGALKALEQVMAQLKLQKTDELIFLGDYVDGWSQSAQVIDYLLEFEKNYNCIFIKGNHDDWCEQWLKDGFADEEWLQHGGAETVKSYDGYSKDQKDNHVFFFNRMSFYEIDHSNRLFVHAGFSSMHGPLKEHFLSNFFWDRTLWEVALVTNKHLKQNSKSFPRRLSLFKEIFIGHTPTTNYGSDIPMKAANVWNVDTGAAFTGKLTALEIESKSFWQSDTVYTLYPDEKGRNKYIQ
jgi:serine/threonine protein phosphatase 1